MRSTIFWDTETGRRWMSVVNAHQRLSNRIKLTFQSGKTEQFWLAPGEMKLLEI